MRQRILVADDDRDILAICSAYLSGAGYGVILTEDGEQALRLIRQERPDFLVLDYFLPGMRGDEICRVVKADQGLRHIPICLISARISGLDADAVRTIPCEAMLTKPFDLPVLLRKIRRLLSVPSA